MENEKQRSAGGAAAETESLQGGEPIEPTPQAGARHPTSAAEERCEDVQKGEQWERSGKD